MVLFSSFKSNGNGEHNDNDDKNKNMAKLLTGPAFYIYGSKLNKIQRERSSHNS